MSEEEDVSFVVLGKFGRPHGTRGEVRLWLYNDESELLSPGMEVLVDSQDGDTVDVITLRSMRWSDRFMIVRVDGVRFRDQAESFRNREIFLPRDALPEPEEDELYLIDLLQLPVWARLDSGEEVGPIGHVENFMDSSTANILIIRGNDQRRILVDMASDAIERMDPDEGKVVLGPIELWDLDEKGLPPIE